LIYKPPIVNHFTLRDDELDTGLAVSYYPHVGTIEEWQNVQNARNAVDHSKSKRNTAPVRVNHKVMNQSPASLRNWKRPLTNSFDSATPIGEDTGTVSHADVLNIYQKVRPDTTGQLDTREQDSMSKTSTFNVFNVINIYTVILKVTLREYAANMAIKLSMYLITFASKMQRGIAQNYASLSSTTKKRLEAILNG
jgi:hypothetical protein